MDTAPNIATPQRRWPLFLIGILLFVLGPISNAFQMYLEHLVTPWQVPILGTLGVLCMAVSFVQNRGIVRMVALAVFVLLCGVEWLFIGVLTKAPPYAGAAQPGSAAPAFAALRADGKPFTHHDLKDRQHAAIVFYRGHW